MMRGGRQKQALVQSCLLLFLAATVCNSSNPSIDKPFQAKSLDRLTHVPCVTVYHRNGRIGCGTWTRDAATGVLARFSSSLSSLEEKVVWVMTQDEFTSSNVKELVSELTQGILVLNITSSTTSSPAATTPNGAGTPAQDLAYDDNVEWNPNGNGIESLDLYGTPTMYVPDPTTSSYLLQVATEQQQQLLVADKSDAKSYIVAELKSYMGGSSSSATLTSEKCLSWRNTD